MCRSSVRSQLAVETSNNHLADSEVHHPESALALRCSYRAIGSQPEASLPPHGKARHLKFFKIFQGQSCAYEVSGNRLILVAVTGRSGDYSGAASAFFSGRKEPQFRVRNAHFIRRDVQLPSQTIKGKSVHSALSQIEKACKVGLLPCTSPVKLPRQ